METKDRGTGRAQPWTDIAGHGRRCVAEGWLPGDRGGAGCTSHLYRGLQFPRRPPSRRPRSCLPSRRAGVGAGGGARHVERRGREGGGEGGAGARARLFKGARAELGEAAPRLQTQARLTAETRGAPAAAAPGPSMRRSVWLALAASLLHGKAAGFPALHSCSLGSRAQRGRLGAPRARARFGVARGIGSCPGRRLLAPLVWAAQVGRRGSWQGVLGRTPAGLP